MEVCVPGADMTSVVRSSPIEVMIATEEARFVRMAGVGESVMQTVTSLIRHIEAAGLTPLKVKTTGQSSLSCSESHPLYFTNICGKVEHYNVCRVTRDSVDPYVNDQTDAFGSAFCLYSRECSLRISKAMTSTLFRGGSSSTGIAVVLEHALIPETIRSTTIHMIVGSARLGRPILMHDDFLATKMSTTTNWQCQNNIIDGEMQKYHSMKLHSFDVAWLRGLGLEGPYCPQSCLLNICRTGTVNAFVSISPGVPFAVGVEDQYVPMLNSILGVVMRFT